MRIALGQINSTVGDLPGNVRLMVEASRRASELGAELIAFPELSLTGYPPRDVVEKESFLDRTAICLDRFAAKTADLDLTIVAGYVSRSAVSTGKQAVNSAAVIERGKIVFRQDKMLLPTYDVFDEGRYFLPAEKQTICVLRGTNVALAICENAWNDKQYWERRLYTRDPVEELAHSGAQVLITINASPYHMGKRAVRREIFQATALRHKIPVIYVNQVG